jgi:hypothetical protein
MRLMVLPMFLALLHGSHASPRATRAGVVQSTCPASDPVIRNAIHLLISDARVRTDVGLTSVNPDHLRALNDAQDAAVCQYLASQAQASPNGDYTPRWAYFEADGFYFAGLAGIAPGGAYVPSPGVVIVLNHDLQVLRTATL